MSAPPPRTLQARPLAAFTLLELLLVITILGVLGAVSWRVIVNDLQRARLNAVSQEFVDWVESIRKAALRTQGGCQITVVNLSNAVGGTQLASVQNLNANDPPCSPSTTFNYRAATSSGQLSSAATNLVFTLTPRGTILGANNTSLPADVEVRLALQGISQLRCLRLSGLLGTTQIGSNNTSGNVGTSCTNWGRF